VSALITQMQHALRARHYSRRTEQTYCQWARRYIRFHALRHPAGMGEGEINAFLTHLAVDEHVSASTQTQALSALLLLYRHVLGREVGELELVRASRPRHLSVVLTRAEVCRLLTGLEGEPRMVAALLYGSGLRLMEGLRLRVCDLEPGRGELVVRRPRGPTRTGSRPARTRPHRRLGARRAARRPGAQVPAGGVGVALAVALPAAAPLAQPRERRRGTPPSA
jgi:site-specific recombinase XerD